MPVKSFEEYLEHHPQWEEELRELREMLMTTELSETIKWGAPTYTVQDKKCHRSGRV